MQKSLKDILVKDLEIAKKPAGGDFEILPPGEYVAKVIGFTEEENYQYITVEINKKRYNFFYNYFNYGTQDLNYYLIDWIKSLSTVPMTENMSLLEIANSSIGNSYKITIYNYTGKVGKNAGKVQHALDFKVKPELQIVDIITEEVELPY